MKIKEWNTAKEIAEICNISERTIERKRIKMIKDNINNDWFKTKTKPYKYKIDFLSEFLSTNIFQLVKRCKQMENTIDCLKRKDSIEQHLSYFQWDYFITIAYEQPLSKKQCFTEMSKLYEKINSTSKGTNRMFFVTEPFNNRTGYHNHFILKSSLNKEELIKLISSQLPKGKLDIKTYDPHLAGFFYICKKGVKGEDWDILGNRLKQEAEEIF
jgi:hypothetical protein